MVHLQILSSILIPFFYESETGGGDWGGDFEDWEKKPVPPEKRVALQKLDDFDGMAPVVEQKQDKEPGERQERVCRGWGEYARVGCTRKRERAGKERERR
jgi:hypothetical protein